MIAVKVPKGTVYLAPRLTVPMGAAAMAVLNGVEPTIGPMQAALTQIYLSPAPAGGIVGWEGPRFTRKVEGIEQPEPINSESIERLLPWAEGGAAVAEKADELYAGDLFRPLVERSQTPSPPTSMDDSTPASDISGSKSPKRSKQSSPNGSAGMRSVVPAR